jgi:hypothetical protein
VNGQERILAALSSEKLDGVPVRRRNFLMTAREDSVPGVVFRRRATARPFE